MFTLNLCAQITSIAEVQMDPKQTVLHHIITNLTSVQKVKKIWTTYYEK